MLDAWGVPLLDDTRGTTINPYHAHLHHAINVIIMVTGQGLRSSDKSGGCVNEVISVILGDMMSSSGQSL